MTRFGRYHRRIKRPSSTGYGEKCFLDLCQSEVPDQLQVEMRQVRQLVGNDNGIDDCRAIDGEGLSDRRLQFARLSGCKAVTAAGTRQSGKVGIGKLDAFPERRHADALGLQRDQPEARSYCR